MSGRATSFIVLVLTAGSVMGLAQALAPGDPTTIFASGFTRPCRLAFDGQGNLFVAEIGLGEIYRVTPSGVSTLYSDAVADPRGIAFDAFGTLLVASSQDSAVYKISSQGVASRFLTVVGATNVITGPDGAIWVTRVDTLHHFDAVGRLLESIDVGSSGASASGLMFSPSGELYMSNWYSLWKLVNGQVVELIPWMPPRFWSPAFDQLGNIYSAHEAVDISDTDRVILHNSSGDVLNDTLISEVQGPCRAIFGRDTDGTTNSRLFIGQVDGVIREANPAGVAAPGWPVGFSIDWISDDDAGDHVLGVDGKLDANETRFLDVIGNDNGSYDVGDFRAFLVATGVVSATAAPAR